MKREAHPLIDLTGKRFGAWVVLSEHRRTYSTPGRNSRTQWKCQCSCGVEDWVSSQSLREGRSRSCGCKIVQESLYPVGAKLGEMEVIETLPTKSRRQRDRRLRCICGRIRVFGYVALYQERRMTCGCNGEDRLWVGGDPNLPKGVKSYQALIRWAGITHQAYYDYLKRNGLAAALLHLTQHAEKNHPSEGWRILAILPGPHDKEKTQQATTR